MEAPFTTSPEALLDNTEALALAMELRKHFTQPRCDGLTWEEYFRDVAELYSLLEAVCRSVNRQPSNTVRR